MPQIVEPRISASDGDPDGDEKSDCVASDIDADGEEKSDGSGSDVDLPHDPSYEDSHHNENAAEGTNAAAVKEDPNGTRFGNAIAPDLDQ